MGSVRDLSLAGALSTLLYASMVFVPAGAAFAIWIVPLPGVIVAARHPDRAAVWFLGTTAALAAIVNVESAIAFAATVGTATLMIAFGIARSWTIERTALSAIGIWLLGMTGLYVVTAGSVSAAVAAAQGQIDEAFSLAIEASRVAGAEPKAVELLESERANLVQSVLDILPALVTLTGAAILCVNVAMARRVVSVFEDFRLRYWRAPANLIWAFIASGFCMFIPLQPISLVAGNVFLLLLGCYFLQGLAVVTYYFDHFRLPIAFRIGTYLLIGIQQLLAAVVLALGIFDLWGDFRRLHTGAADASAGTDGD
jgi:uncharacterized protein YybS (DUF2232 family)